MSSQVSQNSLKSKHLYSASQKKGNPWIKLIFLKTNDLSEKVYIVTKFNLSSFFWHQLQDVLAMHGQARTISNGDVHNGFAQNRNSGA